MPSESFWTSDHERAAAVNEAAASAADQHIVDAVCLHRFPAPADEPPTGATRPGFAWQVAWFWVFGANLVVPLIYGLEVTRTGGRWGMWIAVAFTWLCGHLACGRRPLGAIFVIGGVVVALSQLFPMLQFFCGAFSLEVVSKLGLGVTGLTEVRTEFAGFVTTMLTASQLMFVAVVCGFVLTGGGRTMTGRE
jgi:hypothetical protein